MYIIFCYKASSSKRVIFNSQYLFSITVSYLALLVIFLLVLRQNLSNLFSNFSYIIQSPLYFSSRVLVTLNRYYYFLMNTFFILKSVTEFMNSIIFLDYIITNTFTLSLKSTITVNTLIILFIYSSILSDFKQF